jgi:hypothetical protein
VPEEIDDFTIVLPGLIDMGTCDLKVYNDLDRLWRMVERYKMTAPIMISVVDNKAKYVRAICGNPHQAADWQLKDETSAVERTPGALTEGFFCEQILESRVDSLLKYSGLQSGKPLLIRVGH